MCTMLTAYYRVTLYVIIECFSILCLPPQSNRFNDRVISTNCSRVFVSIMDHFVVHLIFFTTGSVCDLSTSAMATFLEGHFAVIFDKWMLFVYYKLWCLCHTTYFYFLLICLYCFWFLSSRFRFEQHFSVKYHSNLTSISSFIHVYLKWSYP